MEKNLIVTSNPHITENVSTQKLMGNVVVSLLPCVVASAMIFGFRALLLTAVTVAACVGFELRLEKSHAGKDWQNTDGYRAGKRL